MEQTDRQSEEQQDIGQDVSSPMIFVIGVLATLVLIVIIILLAAVFSRSEQAEYKRKVVQQQYAEVSDLRAEQLTRLGAFGWIDRQHGVVATPIDYAMELALGRLQSGEPLWEPAQSTAAIEGGTSVEKVAPADLKAAAVTEQDG